MRSSFTCTRSNAVFVACLRCSDTDSVMVSFHVEDERKQEAVKLSMELARRAAAEVTSAFPKPIALEFEKVSVESPQLSIGGDGVHCEHSASLSVS